MIPAPFLVIVPVEVCQIAVPPAVADTPEVVAVEAEIVIAPVPVT